MAPAGEDRSVPETRTRWRPDAEDLQVLSLLAEGHTVEVIARRTGVSERTVRRRLRATADRMGVDSTIEAVVQAVRRGLI